MTKYFLIIFLITYCSSKIITVPVNCHYPDCLPHAPYFNDKLTI